MVALAEKELRVLLVEDSPRIAERVRELLVQEEGVHVLDTVEDENAALRALTEQVVDVLILDLQLRTGSGFGVLRAIKQRPSAPAVVVFTNFAIGAYRETALALGARHFLDKSRDYARLPAVLQELSESTH